MAYYLKGKNQECYDKHYLRCESRKATKGERIYSRAWIAGFNEIWNDKIPDTSWSKSVFEKTAYNRGRKFAQKVLKE